MSEQAFHREIPVCRVSVGGSPLPVDKQAALTRVTVDLDADLFGQCALHFNDPHLKLIDGNDFAAGTAIKVELGFGAQKEKVFEGEVVGLMPQFRRDLPPFLRVVCLGHHLERLPDELKDPFVDLVCERAGSPLVLDYVRLNIDARKPEEAPADA